MNDTKTPPLTGKPTAPLQPKASPPTQAEMNRVIEERDRARNQRQGSMIGAFISTTLLIIIILFNWDQHSPISVSIPEETLATVVAKVPQPKIPTVPTAEEIADAVAKAIKAEIATAEDHILTRIAELNGPDNVRKWMESFLGDEELVTRTAIAYRKAGLLSDPNVLKTDADLWNETVVGVLLNGTEITVEGVPGKVHLKLSRETGELTAETVPEESETE